MMSYIILWGKPCVKLFRFLSGFKQQKAQTARILSSNVKFVIVGSNRQNIEAFAIFIHGI